MAQHVLITGAAGFIGGYTVTEFVNAGWHVLALVHRHVSPQLESLAASGSVTLIKGDVTNPDTLALPDTRLDAIVHCAGRASDVGWRSEFRKTNFESVQYLVELTKKRDVPRFVFISTTDVYGMRDFHGETEDELPLLNNVHNAYPEFKIAAEQWIREHLPAERYAIIRPAAVWGVGDTTLTGRAVAFLRSSPWIMHFGKRRGQNRWPMAHVRNVASAIHLAATMPEVAGQAINVLDSEVTTVDEFYRLIAAIYLPQKRFRSITLPLLLGKGFGWIISVISDLFN